MGIIFSIALFLNNLSKNFQVAIIKNNEIEAFPEFLNNIDNCYLKFKNYNKSACKKYRFR